MATYSTLAAAQAAYLVNADYAETASASKAAAFASACRALLLLLPSAATQGDRSTTFNMQAIREEMLAARQFIQEADGGGGLVDVSFEEFRT